MRPLRLSSKALTKKMLIGLTALWAGFSLLTGSTLTISHAQKRSVTIGTGGIAGLYYHTGKSIADIVNKKSKKHKLQVKVEFTGASVFNVNAMMIGDLEFGIVQSDRQYQAWHGLMDWKDRGPRKKLRSICSFYPESVVLVAGNDTQIEAVSDLIGKHINIGNLGSGARGNAIDTMQSCGLDWRNQLSVEGLRAADAVKMFQTGRLDAIFHTIGHPNDLIKEVTSGERKVHFVPLIGRCIEQLVEKWPYYAMARVPINFYPKAQNKEDVNTFGVKATLCTSADISDEIVYIITKEIFTNLQALKELHPAYGMLTKNKMLEALCTPLHPGAVKFFKETDLTIPRSLLGH